MPPGGRNDNDSFQNTILRFLPLVGMTARVYLEIGRKLSVHRSARSASDLLFIALTRNFERSEKSIPVGLNDNAYLFWGESGSLLILRSHSTLGNAKFLSF